MLGVLSQLVSLPERDIFWVQQPGLTFTALYFRDFTVEYDDSLSFLVEPRVSLFYNRAMYHNILAAVSSAPL